MFRLNAANFLRLLRKEAVSISILRRDGDNTRYEAVMNKHHLGVFVLYTGGKVEKCHWCGATEGFDNSDDGWDRCVVCKGN